MVGSRFSEADAECAYGVAPHFLGVDLEPDATQLDRCEAFGECVELEHRLGDAASSEQTFGSERPNR